MVINPTFSRFAGSGSTGRPGPVCPQDGKGRPCPFPLSLRGSKFRCAPGPRLRDPAGRPGPRAHCTVRFDFNPLFLRAGYRLHRQAEAVCPWDGKGRPCPFPLSLRGSKFRCAPGPRLRDPAGRPGPRAHCTVRFDFNPLFLRAGYRLHRQAEAVCPWDGKGRPCPFPLSLRGSKFRCAPGPRLRDPAGRPGPRAHCTVRFDFDPLFLRAGFRFNRQAGPSRKPNPVPPGRYRPRGGDHSSRTPVARRLQQPTRGLGRAVLIRPPTRFCSGWGLPSPRGRPRGW